MDDRPNEERAARPSKTRRKKDMLALQDLGEELVRLPETRLQKLGLPEELREAVVAARHIRSFPALRRQMQFIGRLMRGVDAEPIAAQLAAWKGQNDLEAARFHRIERWRERLMTDDAALTGWLAEHPASDVQRLRAAIRNARKETAEGAPPKWARVLFRLLRDEIERADQTGRVNTP